MNGFIRRVCWLGFALSALVAGPARAQAQTPPAGPAPALIDEAGVDAGLSREEPAFAPWLAPWPGPGITVQCYTGLSVYRTKSATWGHGVLGGALRARYGYLTLGGYYEESDFIEQGQWSAVGGFAGAHLPFARWVDFDLVVGGGTRTHEEEEVRYGPHGYSITIPTLVARLGVSGRSAVEAVAAVRVGFELWAVIDLDKKEQPWRVEYERGMGIPPTVYTGTTDVGGTSVGMLVTFGFDVLFVQPPRAKRAS